MGSSDAAICDLHRIFGQDHFVSQPVCDADIPMIWVAKDTFHAVLRYLKSSIDRPYRMLYDMTAIDERVRNHREGQPPSDFTVVYHLLSFERNASLRIKVALLGEYPSLPTITDTWPAANWYEREVWDMFGITFDGHLHMTRLLLPPTWDGHPLRKEHPARATEMGEYRLPDDKQNREQEALRFKPEDWGMKSGDGNTDFMFLNLGPNHPGVHGVFRIILQLDGEEIVDAVPDIGYHHRGAEKMAERQSWHSYIPYTDRIDYLGGVMNNLPYVLAVEKLAGIVVPDRVKVIRVMMAEFFRIASHLVFYGTFVQDIGALSPVFYMFSDRERVFDIVEAICGGRMHPSWFRIGGVAHDLPEGWDRLVADFLTYFKPRMDHYDRMLMGNKILKKRTQGVGQYTVDEAIEWGVTGAGLRACGLEWDFRKKQPYSGYDQFEFDIPIATHGDSYDRCWVRVQELRQSVRIIEQCLAHMPAGEYKARHHLTTPPLKDHTMHDIETLINHFLGVSWGPVMPPGEAFQNIEATKGANGYYLVSDGSTMSYRTRIRTPSFPHLQMIPLISRGFMIPDLIATLGSIDFVMADVDR
ncbi:NADH:ubiquinone oxidoreductase, chain C,D [Acidithiobacillus ferrivorans]|uniref:NADH:ubiquinone oxidoreductase, chain C,D n=1 Tax=Acidithiobacillus ferrivorans TaxID=160808 RepID=A0A060UTX6_9PROT|nr:NADH-quinone oxidoreductase subunit C/D [Acidithiobacillus ferrivorans]CDQ11791.1 NADH:ubiquinone oxidoreductase, chain C,D [Acidithiobacillus ferrivorans]SMH65350.1 NADH:ubiquinone oxidoreductase, chain C,D [Acidithiobacillus ferrivorans]